MAPAFGLVGAILGALLLRAIYHLRRAYFFLFGVLYPLVWYACLYGSGYAKSTLGTARARLAFWSGDLSHADWLGAGAVTAAAIALAAAALLGAAARRDRRL